MRLPTVARLLLAAMGAASFAWSPATAQSASRKEQVRKAAEIPTCAKKLGTIAVVEPDNNRWSALQLGSPEAIIKLFVMRSGCFGLVDRGRGLQSRAVERALAEQGELQKGSNIGRGQVRAADHFIVPDLVTKNQNAGGNAVGAVLGGLLGRSVLGGIAGGINVRSREANVTLTLVNARTTEQERLAEGFARRSDLSWGAAAGGGGGPASARSARSATRTRRSGR